MLVLILLYIFASGLCSFGSLPSYDREAVSLGAKLGFLIFLILFGYVSIGKARRMPLLFLPFFLVPFTNIIALAVGGSFSFAFSSYDLLRLFLLPLGVFIEEIVFRDLALKGRESKKERIEWLFISSLLFALSHLSGGFSASSLLQVAYTFGLGLLCGLLYLEGGGFYPSFALHLLFNLFNSEVYRWAYGDVSDVAYYTVNIGTAVIVGAYFVFLFVKKMKP